MFLLVVEIWSLDVSGIFFNMKLINIEPRKSLGWCTGHYNRRSGCFYFMIEKNNQGFMGRITKRHWIIPIYGHNKNEEFSCYTPFVSLGHAGHATNNQPTNRFLTPGFCR